MHSDISSKLHVYIGLIQCNDDFNTEVQPSTLLLHIYCQSQNIFKIELFIKLSTNALTLFYYKLCDKYFVGADKICKSQGDRRSSSRGILSSSAPTLS